ncbi:MAG: family 43 glycosylhydrolase [Jatrophihabitans endophyticus]|nr:family 43 glycosylhydrolase [Jatrophihabitans endophyticus]
MSSPSGGNPLFQGWYADPEIHCFAGRYYIYPSVSAPYREGTFFECWSSDDLTNWRNEGKILDLADVRWSTNYAAWAPSVAEKNGRYYFYFSAGDGAGIGVAVSDSPTGPFRDAIGIPLVHGYPHGAQPIDAHCFQDDDGEAYLYFGGHDKCAAALLNPTMLSFRSPFRDVTPTPEYREAPFMVKRRGVYYFMWSEGYWTDDTYRAAYGTSNHPFGPFEYGGKILVNNPAVAKSAGHHSVMRLPGTEDDWIICYHRRPLDATDRFHRVVCAERLVFQADGTIATATLTHEGVPAHPARAAG